MKTKLFITIGLTFAMCFPQIANAGGKTDKSVEYRRSSLMMVLMEDPEMDPTIRTTVHNAFANATVPLKFNDHDINEFKIFTPADISEDDLNAYDALKPQKKKSFGSMLGKAALSAASDGQGSAYLDEINALKRKLGAQAYKFIKENNISHKVMDKWFSLDEQANTMSLQLIEDRAQSEATPTELLMAQAQNNVGEFLQNTGLDLLGNTFIVINRYRYLTAQEYADELAKIADAMSGGAGFGSLVGSVNAVTNTVSKSDKNSYVVEVKTYLFQMVWNDDVKKAIEDNYGNIEAYKALNFDVKFIGQEAATASCGAKDTLSQEQVIEKATMRAFNKVIGKMEKKYEEFRTKTPITSVDPVIEAEIGTMESVEKKDKYEILEQKLNEKTKAVEYRRIGTVTVDPDGIWQNDEDAEGYQQEGTTKFIGKVKNATPGMLLRQISK